MVDNKTFLEGIERNCPIVMDVEDKITALKEKVDKEHISKLVLRTLDSSIGECSNCATYYHNKTVKDDENHKKYQDYINLLSIITGKSINKSVDYKFCEPANVGCVY